jgi:hypothetical protein
MPACLSMRSMSALARTRNSSVYLDGAYRACSGIRTVEFSTHSSCKKVASILALGDAIGRVQLTPVALTVGTDAELTQLPRCH